MHKFCRLFTFLLLSGVYSLARSEHAAHHKHIHHESLHSSTKLGVEDANVLLPGGEPFQASSQKQFSWSDPDLVAHLWGGAEKVPQASTNIPDSISGYSHQQERSIEKRVYRQRMSGSPPCFLHFVKFQLHRHVLKCKLWKKSGSLLIPMKCRSS